MIQTDLKQNYRHENTIIIDNPVEDYRISQMSVANMFSALLINSRKVV